MDFDKHDRRSHPRYKVKGGTFLYNETTFAEIINISKGGVCCKFLTDFRDPLNPINRVDLINSPDKTCIQNILCTDLNYYDPQSIRHLTLATVRESRLQFKTMDSGSFEELSGFIDTIITDQV
jgi:hypothetical protein